MPLRIATVIGATGLIGSNLVEQLQRDDDIQTIRVLIRRPVAFAQSKVETKLVNFADPESFKLAIDGSNAVFCAVGTTQKKVKGDEAAYRRIDFDIPVAAARYCAETGCGKFLLVSSVGANGDSGNFYLQLKGETEDAVQQLPVRTVSIFRPSILLGKRAEARPAERIGQVAMQGLSFLLAGGLRKYKSIDAATVAKAMVLAAKKTAQGRFIYDYDGMMNLIKSQESI